MALQARLALLEQLRQDLAHNIAALGVSASATETLETLVPKVLLVLGGTEGFTASILPEWDISYGVFTTGEIVSMDGMVTVTSASRIKALSITVTGTGVSSLTAAGSGWSWSTAMCSRASRRPGPSAAWPPRPSGTPCSPARARWPKGRSGGASQWPKARKSGTTSKACSRR